MKQMKPWMIVTSGHLKAAESLNAALLPYLGDAIPCEPTARTDWNPIFLKIDPALNGYKIEVSKSDGEQQEITLTGRDEIYLRYAVADFKNIYLPYARSANSTTPYYFNSIFSEPLKPFNYESAPRIAHRGIWTWGHKIYDYRRWIDRMVDLKLNTLIIWNDHPPVNLPDVLHTAHENGIQVYLGFACGWGVKMPERITEAFCEQVVEDTVAAYERHCGGYDCDGIYLQTFTENMPEILGDVCVIEAAVDVINRVGDRLMQKKPDLKLLFGLHAGCALSKLEKLQRLDPKISVIWEDVGAFPYGYVPTKVENFDQTLKDTRRIRDLRTGGFGAVLKGVTCLNWGIFKHQEGPFVMGVSDRRFLKAKADEKREILRWVQAGWMRNATYAKQIIDEYPADAMVTCLVEDALFEEIVNYPTALYAAMLWDSKRPLDDIIFETALRPDVDFV